MKKILIALLSICSFGAFAQTGGAGWAYFTAAADTAPSWTPGAANTTYDSRFAINYSTGEQWKYISTGWVEQIFSGVHANTAGDTLTGAAQKLIFDTNNGNLVTRNNGTSAQISLENAHNVLMARATASSGAAFPVDLSAGTLFAHTVTSATVTVGNPTNMAGGRFGNIYRLILKNASGAGATVTFGTSFNKKDGTDIGNVAMVADDSLIYNFQLEKNGAAFVMTSTDGAGIAAVTTKTFAQGVLDSTNVIQLGNAVGVTNSADRFLQNRFIPLNGKSLLFGDATSNLINIDGTNDRITINGSAGTEKVNIIGKIYLEQDVTTQNVIIGRANGNPTGAGNTIIGRGTGPVLSTGVGNTLIGRSAGALVTNKSSNTLVGDFAGTGGNFANVTALGYNTLTGAGGQDRNTAIGSISQQLGGNGGQNTSVGYSSLRANLSGVSNTAIGDLSLDGVTTSNNTGVGFATQASSTGLGVTTIGYQAGRFGNSNYTVFTGYDAGIYSRGTYAMGLGRDALKLNNGIQNIGIGYQAGQNLVGDNNTAIGAQSSYAITGTSTTFSPTDINTGTNRVTLTAHGQTIGAYLIYKFSTTGTLPTGLLANEYYQMLIIDANTLQFVSTTVTTQGTGTHTLERMPTLTNTTAIGNSANPDASNQVVFGNGSVTQIKAGLWRLNIDATPTTGQVLAWDGTEFTPTNSLSGQNRQNAVSGSTYTVTAISTDNIFVEVPTIGGAGTIIALPTASSTLANKVIVVKFTANAGNTVTINVNGGGNLESPSGTIVTSFTNTTDRVAYTFQLNNTFDTWVQR
jgi:hypothetical protein